MATTPTPDAEHRVELMIDSGKAIVRQAIDYIESELQTHIIGFVAAFSGGDDSIVATHFANSVLPDCVTFNADTMIGLKPTREHITRVIEKHKWHGDIRQATAEGPPNATAINSELRANWIEGQTSYEEAVLNYGFGGPSIHPRMYQRLKERPLMRLRRDMQTKRGGRLLIVSGIRHDESSIRAGYKRAWQDAPKTGVTWVNPFYDFTAADFELYRQEFGLPRNPVKRICGISGECCCGTFGSTCERQAYRQVDPAFADYLDQLEAKVMQRFPWGWGNGPPQWWLDAKRGQAFLFDMDEKMPTFQPMCVGCNNGRR